MPATPCWTDRTAASAASAAAVYCSSAMSTWVSSTLRRFSSVTLAAASRAASNAFVARVSVPRRTAVKSDEALTEDESRARSASDSRCSAAGRVDHGHHLTLAHPLTGLDAQVGEGAVGRGADRGGGASGHRAGRLDDLIDGAERGRAESDAAGLVAARGRGEGGQHDAGGEQHGRTRGDARHERHSNPARRQPRRADTPPVSAIRADPGDLVTALVSPGWEPQLNRPGRRLP